MRRAKRLSGRMTAHGDDGRSQSAREHLEVQVDIWSTRRASPFSVVRLAKLRASRGRALLSIISVGILAAMVLICTVPLYVALVTDIQVQHALHADDLATRNIQVSVRNTRISRSAQSEASAMVTGLGARYLSGFTAPPPTYFLTSGDLQLQLIGHTRPSADSDFPAPKQIYFAAFDYALAAPHMRFLAGGSPHTNPGSIIPQAIITQEMAHDERLHVGDTLTAAQISTYFGFVSGVGAPVTARVVGIWQPGSLSDPFWNGLSFEARPSLPPRKPSDLRPIIYPVLVTTDAFFALPDVPPPPSGTHNFPAGTITAQALDMTQNWVFYGNPNDITVNTIDSIAQNLSAFRSQLDGHLTPESDVQATSVTTNLDTWITEVQTQRSLLALPLYSIISIIAGVLLLFVGGMAGLLFEAQQPAFTVLHSRGASKWQLISSFAMRAVFLAIMAALIGPPLAALLSVALVRALIPGASTLGTGVSDGYLVRNAQPATVVAPALIGGLLAIAVLVFAAFQATRSNVLAARREQGRNIRPPLWQRTYLDLALVGLCITGYMELSNYGSLRTRSVVTGGAAGLPASPILLAAPALLLVGGALVLLRVVPFAARAGLWLAARRRGAMAALLMAQMSRTPRRYTRAILLLAMAVGLAIFALNFDSTVAANAFDRAAYSVGADVRITERNGQTGSHGEAIAAQLARLPGVQAVSAVDRTFASTSSDQGDRAVSVLGVDPTTFAAVDGAVAWQVSYADQPLPALLASLRAQRTTSPSAPLWAIVSTQFASMLHVRIGDRFTLVIGETGTDVSFVVGAVVRSFPTLYAQQPAGGFIVTDLQSYDNALSAAIDDPDVAGANEFWLRTTSDPALQSTLVKTLRTNPNLGVEQVLSLRDVLAQESGNPAVTSIQGLLMIGSVTAALLSILGSVAFALLAAKQRVTQFAMLRTIGVTRRQLMRLLLGEQVNVYLIGLLGGGALGLLLLIATLPFLEFSDTPASDVSMLSSVPYHLAVNTSGIELFYVVMLAACGVAVLVGTYCAVSTGLGSALRLGED